MTPADKAKMTDVEREEYGNMSDDDKALVDAGLYWQPPVDTLLRDFISARLEEENEAMDAFQDRFGLPRTEDPDRGDHFTRWIIQPDLGDRVGISQRAVVVLLANLAQEWHNDPNYDPAWNAWKAIS